MITHPSTGIRIVSSLGTTVLALWISFWGAPALANVPRALTVQAHVLDESGQPLSGEYQLTLELWEETNRLWQSEAVDVSISTDAAGYFSVSVPVDDAFIQSVETDRELRMRLTDSGFEWEISQILVYEPYALVADTVARAHHLTLSGDLHVPDGDAKLHHVLMNNFTVHGFIDTSSRDVTIQTVLTPTLETHTPGDAVVLDAPRLIVNGDLEMTGNVSLMNLSDFSGQTASTIPPRNRDALLICLAPVTIAADEHVLVGARKVYPNLPGSSYMIPLRANEVASHADFSQFATVIVVEFGK